MWVSTAFAWETGQTVIFINEAIPDNVKVRLESKANDLGVEVRFLHRDDQTRLLPEGKHRLAIFFSPKDLEYALSWNWCKKAIMEGKLQQRNNIRSACNSEVQVLDLYGWASKSSLESFVTALGLTATNKGLMDQFKSCMWQGLLEHPEDFLTYAVDDARLLLKAYQTFVDHFRHIQMECLNMGGADLWTEDRIPMTNGSLVAQTFERWLYDQAGHYKIALRFGLHKLGLLDKNSRKYLSSRMYYRRAVERYRCPEDLQDADLSKFFGTAFDFTGLDGASVPWFASRPDTESAIYNALVHGGRCCNERPDEYVVGPGLDVDISGCYGASLRSMTYPIGLPRVWSYGPNEKPLTLGRWLEQTEGQRVDDLWTCTVGGILSFEQDLIYSKIVSTKDIAKAVRLQEQGVLRGMRRGNYSTVGEDEGSDIPSDFVLLRKQIVNGIITADVLRVLLKAASKQERKQLLNLEVVTAAAYLKSDRKEGVRDWCEAIMADEGEYAAREVDGGGTTVQDTRSRVWYGVPLEGFIGRLVEQRQEWKSKAKDHTLGEEERSQAKGMDQLLKLCINTFYGDIASRHFQIGNTIVANNITARARVGVWMLAKALGLKQSITDGGIYDPSQVSFFTGSKPGLSTLSRMEEWHVPGRYRHLAPLAGLTDWYVRIQQGDLPTDLDELAMRHVDDFWQPYDLEFPFKLEHKRENTFLRAAYWSKADYALQLPNVEKPKYKLRGKDKLKKDHPMFNLLDAILTGTDNFPSGDALLYSRKGLLKIGKYRIIQQSAGYDNAKLLRPGDNLPEEVHPARYNNTWMRMTDEQDYLHRKKRKKVRSKKPVQWFERHATSGIRGVHSRMLRNQL